MMVPLLLLLAAPMGEGDHGLKLPRLTPSCTLSTCNGGKRASPYRLTPSHSVPIDSKSRAFSKQRHLLRGGRRQILHEPPAHDLSDRH